MPTDAISFGRIRVGINMRDTENPKSRIVGESDAESDSYLETYSDDALSFDLKFRKARGTALVPLNVTTDDVMASIVGAGRATTFFDTGIIKIVVDASVVAGQRPASRIEFWTNANNAAATRKVTIANTGRVGFAGVPVTSGNNDGQLQIISGAAKSGIYLGNAANTAENVLDWYQETTWTPALSFGVAAGTTGITYASRTGRYTRIGNRIFAKASFVLTSKGTDVGVANLSLPIAIANQLGEGGYATLWANFLGTVGCILLRANAALNAPTLHFTFTSGLGPDTVDLVDTDLDNGSSISVTLMYECAT